MIVQSVKMSEKRTSLNCSIYLMYNYIISHSEYASSFFWSTTRTDNIGISYSTVNGVVSSFLDGNVFDSLFRVYLQLLN